ncbi:saccharopine dehydrogenase family protein [Haloterrigena alkaliphila]|uniref:Saccharopine dehydrogenase NADP-binding domain-containing protein n=1 Tax=Haloterrigena alkaliphila TaxID=2816475 RepID=A0A8A2VQZ7_9EURY|nr:saccharopine dehydrogenase NADP-binding domain-containing protein [Haloterrigena alkaliphila]QSX00509.1 saccharopine dehydrogenase NADP-binding domain-containing protein [Haloterrigena alkaliphila]
MPSLLVYGSYGFVGNLIAEEAIDRGLDPILAGRDRERVREQVDELGQPGRRFSLGDPVTVATALEDVDCVLNCAGPFSNTAEALVEGCLRSETDYVDITGEIPVIEAIHDRDGEATGVGVTLLPAAALSTIPMDCLAAHLAERLPDATHLALGVDSFRVPSIGTLRTVLEGADTEDAVRRDGDLESAPTGWKTREIDFGRGQRPAVTMPMGDISTAHYTTGIPNVEMYAVMPQPARLALRSHRYLSPLFESKPVRWTLKQLVGVRDGPSERARERGSAYVWGEARVERGDEEADRDGEGGADGADGKGGERVVSRLVTPDPYVVTVDGAVTVAERVLADDADAGFQTPAGAFGPELVFELEGVEGFFDEETPEGASPVNPLLQ